GTVKPSDDRAPNLETRTRQARELLSQAREDYRAQQYLGCIDRCETLVSTYIDLPESAEAAQLLAEVKNNPEWLRLACDSLSERLGNLYLSLAESWLARGQTQQAISYLERVVQTAPGTRAAQTARGRLAQAQGQSL